MTESLGSHVVAVFGGASAGSVAAEILARRGVRVVVFEQNLRPYGKIEDGLPRWHQQQRQMEYRKIDQRLSTPGVTFVPGAKLGRDIDFLDTVSWGWSAVLLANGAWRDRPLDIPGADALVGHGVAYQNPFVYWFNHFQEAGYSGPTFDIPEGAVCVGGGLASIDVVKICQLDVYGRALAARGVHVPMSELEHEGIPKVCAAHGFTPAELGVRNATLVYRRRVEDMPLAAAPPSSDPAQVKKIEVVRQKILNKAQEKYLFDVRPLCVPRALTVTEGRVTGLVLARTAIDAQGRAETVAGSEHELATALVVSSIGSIPESIPGISMKGPFYDYADWDTGAYAPIPGVFGVGNVVTGKGNIVASVNHGKQVAAYLLDHYLGVGASEERDVTSGLRAAQEAQGSEAAARVAEHLIKVAPLPEPLVEQLLALARKYQAAVGYDGDYAAWIQHVTPADLE